MPVQKKSPYEVKTLNGYPVLKIASAGRPLDDDYKVLVRRPESHMPYVVATWSSVLGDSWLWGHYYKCRVDAEKAFAGMTVGVAICFEEV